MQFSTVLALVGSNIGVALAQGVTSAVAPTASAPAGCSASFDGDFEVTVVKIAGATKRDAPIAKRDSCTGDGHLVATLSGGILTDGESRTGYIASNYQFQFDAPPQAGAIYTAGFSACGNGSLALGGSAVWYECLSGDFYNLYDRNWAAQCEPVEIVILPCGASDAAASQAADGQVVGTQIVTTTIVSALSDGQPQVKTTTTGIPLCQVSQISDGQVQVGTTPCASITSVPAATSTLAPVSQFSDGQIQVTPAASVPTVSSVPASATVVTLPSESVPVATGSTLATQTSAVSPSTTSVAGGGGGGSGSTPTSSTSAAGTSAPASSGAGSVVGAGSVAALLVGIVGAVAFL